MDYQLQVVTLSVSDVDKATEFYTKQAGFTLDVDYHPASGFRVVQLTPPGSACSVQIGTFKALTDVLEGFTDAVGLDRYALYVSDYGAPAGFRLALRRPERITAIITQNGNAYAEGLSDGWNPIRAYWKEPTQANRNAIRSLVQPETTVWQYSHGVADPSLVSPDGYTLDNHYLARPGADEIQLDLFLDYASNIDLYPQFQDYFRTRQPRLLAIWGRNDPFFLPAGAEAFKGDIPAADVRLLDTGHFALETHAGEIATAIRGFLLSPAGRAPAPTGGV